MEYDSLSRRFTCNCLDGFIKYMDSYAVFLNDCIDFEKVIEGHKADWVRYSSEVQITHTHIHIHLTYITQSTLHAIYIYFHHHS